MPPKNQEGFNWDQWANKGASIENLPPEVQSSLSNQFDAISRSRHDPVSSIRNRMFGDSDGNSDSDLSEDRVRQIFNDLESKKQFDREIGELKNELGPDFARYLPVAQGDIERGLSPRKAFLLARHGDLVAAAELSAESRAQEGAKAALRDAEQPIRGSGISSTTASSESPGTGNQWVDSRETYDSQKQKLNRMDFTDAVKWRRDNKDFVEAEKHHGDLVSVSRR
jgi:hypothetical protein